MKESTTIVVTGGAGFIGSAVVRYLVAHTDATVVNVDSLTYAGNLTSVAAVADSERYQFERADIGDKKAVGDILERHQPTAIMHLAAETHVDRSIEGPEAFVATNLVGTYTLLDAAHAYWQQLPSKRRQHFRFLHVSTDEVFGSLGEAGQFSEDSPYDPSSPYAASKAGADHLVRAWHRTYGLPTLITNCSNNFGPFQYPEKLIPVLIANGLQGTPLPIYGDGGNIRDWLYVEDHAEALYLVLQKGRIGETYNVGGENERNNLEVAQAVCACLDDLLPDSPYCPHASLIDHVEDRPGHDRRYAIDARKIRGELGWAPRESFELALRATVRWYLENRTWLDDHYKDGRLGLQRRLESAE